MTTGAPPPPPGLPTTSLVEAVRAQAGGIGSRRASSSSPGGAVSGGGASSSSGGAASSSGALYGAFRLLGYLQRGEPLPSNLTSIPAMKLRVFDLWDELVRTRPDAYIHSALTCNMIMIQVLLFVCVLTYHCCNRTAASPEVLPASR